MSFPICSSCVAIIQIKIENISICPAASLLARSRQKPSHQTSGIVYEFSLFRILCKWSEYVKEYMCVHVGCEGVQNRGPHDVLFDM